MPIAVCKNKEQLIAWCEDTVEPGRFRVLATEEGEVIIEPTKTSRPIKYAYLQTTEASKVAEEIASKFGVKKLELKAYRWDDERSPSVVVLPE